MRQILLLTLPLLLVVSCHPSLETKEECDETGFCLTFQIDAETGFKQGAAELRSPSGKLVEISNYVDDQLDGRLVRFNDRGDSLTVEHYKAGQFEGPYRMFNEEEGYLRQAGQYINGAMNGEWKVYHSNGQLAELITFVDNQEQGAFQEWHPNGQLKAVGSYLDGDNEHGELWLYDENGDLERMMNCERGYCQSVWRAGDPEPAPQRN